MQENLKDNKRIRNNGTSRADSKQMQGNREFIWSGLKWSDHVTRYTLFSSTSLAE